MAPRRAKKVARTDAEKMREIEKLRAHLEQLQKQFADVKNETGLLKANDPTEKTGTVRQLKELDENVAARDQERAREFEVLGNELVEEENKLRTGQFNWITPRYKQTYEYEKSLGDFYKRKNLAWEEREAKGQNRNATPWKNCELCEQEFSREGDRIPKIIGSCGHTFCMGCMRRMKECPVDKSAISCALGELITNYAVLGM